MPPDAVPPEVYRRFAGFEILTGFFGYWPGFQDAEILALRLERPGAEMHLHTFEWGQEADSGRTVLTHHCVVGFRFTRVDDLHLAGFGDRNAIVELRFNVDGRETPPRVMVAFPAVDGLDGRFTCETVEVVSVTPGIPPGSIYAP